MNVLLIGENGNRIGYMTIAEAEIMSKKLNKTIKLVDNKQNIYKIVDFVEKNKKTNKPKQKQHTNKKKEMRFTPTIEQHDLDIKLKKIKDFLLKGIITKISMLFRGRFALNKDAGLRKLSYIIKELMAQNLLSVEPLLKFEGNIASAVLIPHQKSHQN